MLNIKGFNHKIICLILAFVMFAQSPSFALLSGELSSLAEQKKQDLGLIDLVYNKSVIDDYENNLNKQTKEEIDRLQNSAEAKKIADLTRIGKDKYANMWPAYVRASAQKEISKLTNDLLSYLGRNISVLQIMPYDMFEKQYLAAAKEEIKNKFPDKNKTFYSQKLSGILQNYPVGKAYADYKAYAAKEIKWRKNNVAKTDAAAIKITEAYLKILSPQLLNAQALSVLNGLEFDGKPVLNKESRGIALSYHNLYLSKQNFKNLGDGFFSNYKEKKVGIFILSETAESIMSGAILYSADKTAYARTVKALIERSEDSSVFAEILALGFSGLTSAEAWPEIDSLLNRYTQKEQEGSSWYEYLDLSFYAKKITTQGGHYLGKVSSRTQYKSKYAYHNVFTDIAKILAGSGTSQSIAILHKYGSARDINKVIKPFLAGELLSTGIPLGNKTKIALEFANLRLDDITATEEYDLDRALLLKYPGIKNALTQSAVITKESADAKRALQNKYGYLERAAVSGDIILALWGAVGLFKIGAKGIGIADSAYSALKVAKITDRGRKLAFIRNNYSKIAQYADTKNTLLRFKNNFKLFLGKKIDYGYAAKLDNKLRLKTLSTLKNEANTSARTASLSGAEADKAKANLAQAAYNQKMAEFDVLKKYRIFNQQGGIENQKSLLSAQAVLSNRTYDLQNAAKQYYKYLGGFDRAKLYFAGKLSSLWQNTKNIFNAGKDAITRTEGFASYFNPSFLQGPLKDVSSEINPNLLPAPLTPPLLSYQQAMPAFMTKKPFLKKVKGSVFQIFSDRGHGTGFYVDYKGAKFIFTSAHVLHANPGYTLITPYSIASPLKMMPEARLFKLSNAAGRSGKAVLVYQDTSLGYDLALLVPEPSLIKGLKPFKISLKEPAAGADFAVAGYPGNEGFVFMPQEILGSVNLWENSIGYYLGVPSIKKGFSGGPLVSDKGVFGIAVKSDLHSHSYYIKLPTIQEFMNTAFKNLFFDFHFDKITFFKDNPSLLMRYKNLISKYHYTMNSSVTSIQMPYPLELLQPKAKLGRFSPNDNATNISLNGKKFGFSLLKGIGFTPKQALNIMYGIGAAEEHSMLPKLSNAIYKVHNLPDFVSVGELARSVPYPKFYSRHNIYKGISLSAEELQTILKEGLSADKYGTRLSSYFKYSSKKSILFTNDAREAFANSLTGLKGVNGNKIPVVLQMRNSPLYSAADIPFENFSRISVLLDINGVPSWGDLMLKNGLIYFIPYM